VRQLELPRRCPGAHTWATLLALLLTGSCGNDTRPDAVPDGPGAAGAAGQANGPDDLNALCDADCKAQEHLDCVDPTTCHERCRAVYDLVEPTGCERKYLQVLECVGSEGANAYVCVDATSFGFPHGSPCVELSAAVGECIAQ